MNRTTRSASLAGLRPEPGVNPRGCKPLLRWVRGVILGLAGMIMLHAANASTPLTLEQLRRDPALTPDRLMNYFRDFEFRLGEKRQSPEVFLATKTGDCDDFASLAADILREKNYTTKLIAVFMNGQTHVVCYVEEIHGYLDYNLRADARAVQSAGSKLEDVADKVAAYFRTSWRSVSEFTYQADHPRYQRIVFR